MNIKAADDIQIGKWIRRGKRFVCFGAGKLLEDLCERTEAGSHIKWIADNNPLLWGRGYEVGNIRIPVVAPEKAGALEENEIVLLTTTYYMQVCEQLEALPKWRGVTKAYYFPSQADRNYNRLKWFLRRLKARDKIVFRSGLGKYVPGFDYSDNAKALFDYMVAHGYNQKYQLIWFVHEPEDYPQLKEMENVKIVSYEWEQSCKATEWIRYFYHLCTARYLFFTDTHFWLRYCNKGQTRVNLWHGCGFKDRKTKNGPMGKNYDFMTVTSPLYAKIHAEEFGVEQKKLIDTGLAKEDLLFQPPQEELGRLLHIERAEKYIFWLPTFRMAADGLERLDEYELASETGLPIIDTKKKAEQLDNLLAAKNMALIIKLHPVQRNSLISHMKLSRICVLENKEIAAMGFQINTLLSKADALISDYSSVAVDYMLLDRPIAFMLEDLEQYRESRGFVFDNIHEYLPGMEIYTYGDLEKFV